MSRRTQRMNKEEDREMVVEKGPGRFCGKRETERETNRVDSHVIMSQQQP